MFRTKDKKKDNDSKSLPGGVLWPLPEGGMFFDLQGKRGITITPNLRNMPFECKTAIMLRFKILDALKSGICDVIKNTSKKYGWKEKWEKKPLKRDTDPPI